MAILTKGQTFATADSVTSTKLNILVDGAAFIAGASGTTDDSSLEVNGSGRIQAKDLGITTAKIAAGAVTTSKLPNSTLATDGVTYAKLQQVADMRVLGNVAGSLGVAAEVSILDEDDMATDSATSLATQQSIKAYVASYSLIFNNSTVFTGSIPTSYTDLDLSGIAGSNRCMAYLYVTPDVASSKLSFKQKGSIGDIGVDSGGTPTGASGMDTNGSTSATGYIVVPTNGSGVIQWRGAVAGSGGTTVKLVAYQKMVV